MVQKIKLTKRSTNHKKGGINHIFKNIINISLLLALINSFSFADTVADPIINKLIEKGIIESYEAQEIRNEISNVVKRQFDEEKKKEEDKKKEDDKKLKVSGYLQILYKDDQKTTADPLSILRARVTFSRKFTDFLSFSLTPDFAKLAEDKNVEWKGVYIDYIPFKDYLSFRIGQFNQPFGFENVYSSSRKKFVDAPRYLKEVLGSDYDYGIQASFGYKKILQLQSAALNGTTKATETNDKKDIVLKAISDLGFLHYILKDVEVSFSVYDRYYSTATTVSVVNGKHYAVYLKIEKDIFIPTFFTFEYVYGKDLKIKHDVADYIGTLEIKPFRLTKNKYLEGISPTFRYELWDKDINVSDNEEKITSIGVNYYFDKFLRLLVDYRRSEVTNRPAHEIYNFMVQVNF